jgi:hypothetical protein
MATLTYTHTEQSSSRSFIFNMDGALGTNLWVKFFDSADPGSVGLFIGVTDAGFTSLFAFDFESWNEDIDDLIAALELIKKYRALR